MMIETNPTKPNRRGAVLACVLSLVSLCSVASAQLVPERLYYGVKRTMPMRVALPADATGEATIKLYAMNAKEPLASANVDEGLVDLASLFPGLWTSTPPSVQYAQLEIDGEGVGSPVVLQPMMSPTYFRSNPQNPRARPIAQSMGNTYTGIRAWSDVNVVFETSEGDIEFRMRPDHAPNHVYNLIHLAEGGFYTDVIFHRIIGERQGRSAFVVQGGDPTGSGTGGPGYFVDLENSRLEHNFGVLSMARSGDPNSAGSQMFICLSRDGTSFLDGSYTAFAEAVSGGDAIRAMGSAEVGAGDRPNDPPVLRRAYTKPAPPFGTGPAPLHTEVAPDTGR